MKINILLAILFSFLISCNQERRSILPKDISTKLIEVDPKAATVVRTSTLFDSILYIPLTGNEPTALIGEINKIEITQDHFYIFDKKQKKICKYTINGKFVTSIGKVGQGPGENDLLEECNSESIMLNGENITIENNPVLVIGNLK